MQRAKSRYTRWGESMLRRRTALAVIVALSLAMAACGGSSEEATGEAAVGGEWLLTYDES